MRDINKSSNSPVDIESNALLADPAFSRILSVIGGGILLILGGCIPDWIKKDLTYKKNIGYTVETFDNGSSRFCVAKTEIIEKCRKAALESKTESKYPNDPMAAQSNQSVEYDEVSALWRSNGSYVVDEREMELTNHQGDVCIENIPPPPDKRGGPRAMV